MFYKIINRKKKAFTMAADLAGYLLWAPFRLFRRGGPVEGEGIREILVIRTAYLGDVVMTIPVLGLLKKRFPEARISFLTSKSAAEVLRNNPYLDEIITYDPFWFYGTKKSGYFRFIRDFRKRRYDLLIEARSDIRDLLFLVFPLRARYKIGFTFGGGGFLLTHAVPYTGVKHKLEYHLDIAGYLGCDTGTFETGVYLTGAEKSSVRKILGENGIRGPFIAVHPGARHALRRWRADRYAKLYDMVAERYGAAIVVLGAPDEMDVVREVVEKMANKPVSLAGRLSIRELAGVISESSLFICNNSGPMHIAAAMRVPTVVIHGPSKTYWDAPYGNLHRIIEKPFPCRDLCDENSCNNARYHACMEDISVDDVFHAVEDIIKDLKPSPFKA